MSKLCILGEDAEPCFEGSQITKVQFTFDDGFREQLSTMFAELKEILNEGGTKLFNRYAVEIGDELWCSLHKYLTASHPDPKDEWCSIYTVEGIYEENGQKFTILRNRQDMKFYRLDFALTEKDGFVPATEFIEVTKTYVPAETPQFDPEAVKAYELEFKKQENKEDEEEEEEKTPPQEDKASEEEPTDEEEEEDDKKKNKKTYSLEEYEALQTTINELQEKNQNLEDQLSSLIEFKVQVEREKKEEMINSFYMLSDEDKKDVIENIDKYSLDDIEAKLSIICVRNKVNFNLEDEEESKDEGPATFNLDDVDGADDATPAWVKAALDVAKNME